MDEHADLVARATRWVGLERRGERRLSYGDAMVARLVDALRESDALLREGRALAEQVAPDGAALAGWSRRVAAVIGEDVADATPDPALATCH